jgi:hypothetical protein
MKRHFRIGCLVLFISFSYRSVDGQSQTPVVGEVAAKVRKNIIQLRDTLPDFVCTEKITSRVLENGKISKEKVIESLFTLARKETQPKSRIYRMVESREVLAIDGKPVRKGTKMPDAPFRPNEPTLNTLLIVLASDAGAAPLFYDYKITGRESVGDLSALRIEFEQMKPVVGSLRFAGTAWIDLEFMQAVRTELQLLGFARSSVMDDFDAYSVLTDYAKVEIDGKPFWLPKSVKVEGTRRKNGNSNGYVALYLAEYGNCRRFDVSVEINFGNQATSPQPLQ